MELNETWLGLTQTFGFLLFLFSGLIHLVLKKENLSKDIVLLSETKVQIKRNVSRN